MIDFFFYNYFFLIGLFTVTLFELFLMPKIVFEYNLRFYNSYSSGFVTRPILHNIYKVIKFLLMKS